MHSILEFIENVSACMIVCKSQNKVANIIINCIYCFTISIFLAFVVYLYIMIGTSKQDDEYLAVFHLLFILFFGVLVYLMISNRTNKKGIEYYILLGTLYIDVYANDKKLIKEQKKTLIGGIMKFLFLFVVFTYLIISLIYVLKIESNKLIIASIVLALLSYILFVYGNFNEEVIKKRKAALGIIIFFAWLIVAFIRIGFYCENMIQVEFIDILILFFSVVFSISTMKDWLEGVPAKFIKPYSERVHKKKDELVEKYTQKTNEIKTSWRAICHQIKNAGNIIVSKWSNGKRLEVILRAAKMTLIIVIPLLMLWLVNRISTFANEMALQVKRTNKELYYSVEEIVNNTVVTLFLVGSMVGIIFSTVQHFPNDLKPFERVKHIIGIASIECVLLILLIFVYA